MKTQEKILVVQTAFLGDAILTLPLIQKLREIFPDSLIDVVSNPLTAQIFSASPNVNEVIVLEKRGRHKSLFSTFQFSTKLKEKKYTKLFSPHRSFRTSLIVLLSDIKETYGFDISSFRHVYKYLVPYNYNSHEVQRNLDLIGFPHDDNTWKIKPEIKTDLISQEKIDSFIKEKFSVNNIIALAPASIWSTKKYPLEYYKEIISFLINEGYKIVLIGGEKDKAECNNLLLEKYKNHIVSAAGEFSIMDSIELLKNVRLLISNDSAPTHMGMCADIPVLTLYCSTSYEFGFYPYNEKSSYLSYDQLFCKPCGIHGYEKCPIGTFDCGFLLKPDIVISKIKNMLNDKIKIR